MKRCHRRDNICYIGHRQETLTVLKFYLHLSPNTTQPINDPNPKQLFVHPFSWCPHITRVLLTGRSNRVAEQHLLAAQWFLIELVRCHQAHTHPRAQTNKSISGAIMSNCMHFKVLQSALQRLVSAELWERSESSPPNWPALCDWNSPSDLSLMTTWGTLGTGTVSEASGLRYEDWAHIAYPWQDG